MGKKRKDDDPIADRISSALRQYMDSTGKKQHVVADELGVHQTMVSKYLDKRKLPSLEKLAAIATLTKQDANRILGVN